MQYYQFPDPELHASPEGLVYVGGELSVPLLLSAYMQGIFPWPHEGYPMLWFCPPERGIIDFQNLHISRSLNKAIKKNQYKFTFNQAFEQVIHQCAIAKRKNAHGTWITDQIEEAYLNLFHEGYAMSVECWDEESLVAGIYGVKMNQYVSAESMFHLKTDTSKMCFVKLVEYLSGQGIQWMDIQMLTPVTEGLGGKYITRSEFLKRLSCLDKSIF